MGTHLQSLKSNLQKRQKTKKITSNPTKMAQEAAVQARPISKKHLFVRDGMFKAELDEFFKRELAEDGYSGVIVRKSKTCEVIIIATRPSQVLGEKTRNSRIDRHRQQTMEPRTRPDRSLRRTSRQPRYVRRCPSRIFEVQASRRSRCPTSSLRSSPIRHGTRCSRLRSCCFR